MFCIFRKCFIFQKLSYWFQNIETSQKHFRSSYTFFKYIHFSTFQYYHVINFIIWNNIFNIENGETLTFKQLGVWFNPISKRIHEKIPFLVTYAQTIRKTTYRNRNSWWRNNSAPRAASWYIFLLVFQARDNTLFVGICKFLLRGCSLRKRKSQKP